MNNEENLNNQNLENNTNMGGINPPLQEVTVETSVPEEPYPQTDVSTSVDGMMGNPTSSVVEPAAATPAVGESAPSVVPKTVSPVDNTQVPVSTTVGTPNPTGFEDVQKKSKLGIIIAIVVVLLLGVGGYFGYKTFFTSSPYENAITSVFKLLKDNKVDSNVKIDTTIKIDSKMEGFEFLNNYSINYSEFADIKNNSSLMKFDLLEKGSSLIDVAMYLKDNKAYIQSKKLTDKTYYSDDFMPSDDTTIKMDDIYYLADVFEKALKEALKEETATKSDATLSINGNSISVKEHLYTIDKSNIKRVTTNMVNVILNDQKALDILAKISGEEVSDIKKDLEESKNDTDFDGKLKISIYTKGLVNTFAGFNFEDEDGASIKYVVDGDNESLIISLDKDNRLSVIGNKDTADIKLVISGEEFVTGKVTVKDDVTTITISMQDSLTITITMKVQENASLETFDTANATKFEDMTEEEMTAIITKFSEIFENTELYTMLESMFGSDETANTDYNYNYDIDYNYTTDDSSLEG